MPEKCYRMDCPRWPARPPGFSWFAYMDVAAPRKGVAGLTVLGGIEKPVVAKTPDGPLVIVDNGFHWFQFAPQSERWWLTAMFDAAKRLIQFYFDITFENHILPGGESWCRDAYLDVVVDPDGRARLLDEDELAAALAAGTVTRRMHDQARADAALVAAQFAGRAGELETWCRRYLEALLPHV